MLTLSDVIVFAAQKHGKQRDKGGNTYLLHPLRVMLGMETEDEMVVAILHDVLEDTDAKEEDLLNLGCTETQVMAVKALTRMAMQSEDEYLTEIMKSTVARKVKIKDIEDNMRIDRLKNRTNLQQKDFDRFAKYAKSWSRLSGR